MSGSLLRLQRGAGGIAHLGPHGLNQQWSNTILAVLGLGTTAAGDRYARSVPII